MHGVMMKIRLFWVLTAVLANCMTINSDEKQRSLMLVTACTFFVPHFHIDKALNFGRLMGMKRERGTVFSAPLRRLRFMPAACSSFRATELLAEVIHDLHFVIPQALE